MTDDDKYEVLEKIGMRASYPAQCFALADNLKAMAPLELFGKYAESKMDKYFVVRKSTMCACHKKRGSNYMPSSRFSRHFDIQISLVTTTVNT